jgi:hypothetical protein
MCLEPPHLNNDSLNISSDYTIDPGVALWFQIGYIESFRGISWLPAVLLITVQLALHREMAGFAGHCGSLWSNTLTDQSPLI